jgi:peptidoglycan/LPS O-acetylase OafA/YrhL
MQQSQRVSTVRVPALDGVRGLAILWVLSHQLSWPLASGTWQAQVMAPLSAGWIGVQLFFVLSGFLITGIVLDTRHDPQQLKHFYVRRVLRIFPLYYGALALTLCVLLAWQAPLPEGVSKAHEWAIQPWLWAFMSNWTAYTDQHTELFAHFWSLAVEEQFYLLWPLLIYRRAPQAVLKWGCALAVASLLCRLALHRLAPASDATVMALYTFTPNRFDALALGAVAAAVLRCPAWLARWQRHGRVITWVNLAALAVAARLTWGFAQDNPRTQMLGYSLLAWCFACWILSLAAEATMPPPAAPSRWSGWLSWGWLRKVGEVSFGMYVMHLPLHRLLGHSLVAWAGFSAPYSLSFSLAYLLGMTGLLYGLARLSFTWFESPLLRLKDRWARYAPAAAIRA